MRVDFPRQIFVSTNLLGAYAPGSPSEGHCYCGEITGVFIRVAKRENNGLVEYVNYLAGITPTGTEVLLYQGVDRDDVTGLFGQVHNMIMNPDTSNIVYINITAILEQRSIAAKQLEDAMKAKADELTGEEPGPKEGEDTVIIPDPDSVSGHKRVQIPRKTDLESSGIGAPGGD